MFKYTDNNFLFKIELPIIAQVLTQNVHWIREEFGDNRDMFDGQFQSWISCLNPDVVYR